MADRSERLPIKFFDIHRQRPNSDPALLSTLPPVDQDLEAAMEPPTMRSTKFLSNEPSPTAAHGSDAPQRTRSTATLSKPADAEEKRASLAKGDEESTSSVIEQKEDAAQFFVNKLDPHEDPKNLRMWRKVIIMWTMCMGALCSTAASSLVCLRLHGHLENISD